MKKLLSILLAILMIATTIPLVALPASAAGKKITDYSVGDTFEFGYYPQSKVTDSNLITTLNSKGGEWTSYGYYISNAKSDFMKYKDVVCNGDKYRAVTFSSYRPKMPSDSSSADYSYQDNNGYTTGNTYWFKYEPLTWKALDPSTGLVMCTSIIDSQNYYYTDSSRTIDGKTVYANNWEYSTIRTWLNDTFYNTAFAKDQQSAIATTTIKNPAFNTSYPEYNANSTSDKIYLFSYSDIENTSYGFESRDDESATRQFSGTDYAKAQGLYEISSNKCSTHLLRTAGSYSYSVCCVNGNGGVMYCIYNYYIVNFTSVGILPVFNFNLSSEIVQEKPIKITDYSVGDTFEFGYYPQSKVTDSNLITTLNSKGGEWKSYGYYISNAKSDFMKYKDVVCNGEKYRAVTFSSYRPFYTHCASTSSDSRQSGNGYYTDNIYWFKYEPLMWKVLKPSTGLVMCTSIIDSQDYYYSSGDRIIGGKNIPANNWEYSDIRTWLNNTFYNIAFSGNQKSSIATTTIDNSSFSSSYSSYDANSTSDKLYLLSYSDVKNASSYGLSNSDLRFKGTDYAKSQGLYGVSPDKTSNVLLRTAGNNYFYNCYISYQGIPYTDLTVNYTEHGVVPVFNFKTSAEIVQEKSIKITDYSVGDTFEFGSYPQSKVTDSSLISALNSKSAEWVSYNYYVKKEQSDFMKYKDVVYNGEKYRAVTFSAYRPIHYHFDSTYDKSFQDDHGYIRNTVYWFKYEPLTWKVLNPSRGMVMCTSMIDSQAFNDVEYWSGTYYYTDSTRNYYANNYEQSSIRKWLNNTFYNTAFSTEEKPLVSTTIIQNLAFNSDCSKFDANATSDKVYLLSSADVQNTSYGFESGTDASTSRLFNGTDYAQSQGLNGKEYILRSAGGDIGDSTSGVRYDGEVIGGYLYVTLNRVGIIPVFNMNTAANVLINDSCFHKSTKVVGAKEATCTVAGSTGDTVCNTCGITVSSGEVIPALGHESDGKVYSYTANHVIGKCKRCYLPLKTEDHIKAVYSTTPATCTENGEKVYKCSVCEFSMGRTPIEALGHRTDEKIYSKDDATHIIGKCVRCKAEMTTEAHTYTLVSTKDASCIATGSKVYKCTVCEHTKTDVIAKTAHVTAQPIVENKVEATCTTTGSYDEVTKCSTCGTELSRTTKTIPVTGVHTPDTAIKENEVPATCTTEGSYVEVIKCKDCETELSRTTKTTPAAHTPDMAVKENVVPASCTANGSYDEVIKCKECGTVISSTTKAIEKTGHVEKTLLGEDPTCTENGWTTGVYCQECRIILMERTKIPATGHHYVVTLERQEPTCTDTGNTEEKECDVCGDTIKFKELKATGHTPSKVAAVKATMTANGKTAGSKCSVCKKVLTAQKTVYMIKTVALSKTSFVYSTKVQKPTVTVKDSKGNILKKDTDYTIKYSDSSSTKAGTYTVTVTFKGNYSGSKKLTYKIAPAQVKDLKATTVKATSITLTWTKIDGAKYYKVEKYNASTKKWTAVKTVTTNSITISSLNAGTRFQYRVTALDSAKKAMGSASASLTTGTLTNAPSITVTSTKSKTATVSWKKVTGATKYRVYYSTDGTNFKKAGETTKTTYDITKLTGGKKVYVKVYAVNPDGLSSQYSTTKNVTVKK